MVGILLEQRSLVQVVGFENFISPNMNPNGQIRCSFMLSFGSGLEATGNQVHMR